jgi:hypothetical protein
MRKKGKVKARKPVKTKDLTSKGPKQVKGGVGASVVGGLVPGGAIVSAAASR